MHFLQIYHELNSILSSTFGLVLHIHRWEEAKVAVILSIELSYLLPIDYGIEGMFSNLSSV